VIATLIIITKVYFRHENIQTALEFGHLAELPEDAKNIKVETAGSMFSRTFWLTFESSDEQINRWIKKSREPKLQEWKKIDNNNNAVISRLDSKTGKFVEVKVENLRHKQQPEWFNPEALREGELYEVSIASETLYGGVWIDKRNRKVYIKTSYS
jgi:hypothetical protein